MSEETTPKEAVKEAPKEKAAVPQVSAAEQRRQAILSRLPDGKRKRFEKLSLAELEKLRKMKPAYFQGFE